MADKVASLYGELNLEDNMTPALKKAQGNLSSFSTGLKSAGRNVSDFGAGILKMSAPLVAGFGAAVKAAVDFDEQITNVASVMGYSAQESDAMGQSMLALSETTKFSATELAGAMYDVVGGVADASKHMDILAASASLAEANNSALDGSTNALISTMNAYRDANVSASTASDVLTMTVKQGVGTMDELAAKFGTTATLAAPLGIDIAELGMLFAELSKNGATFSESGTRIEAALSSLINPTVELEDAFKKMGMTQSDVIAMLEEQGLTAVIQKMVDAGVDLTAVFGNKEALLGVLAIANIDSTALADFTTGMEGATAAAQAIQAEGAKFQWDTLVGDFNDMAVVVGQALLPAFSGIMTTLSPIVQGFADWAKNNPELVQTIATLALGAMALGAVLIPLGAIIGTIGTVLGVVGTGFGVIVTIATGVAGALGTIAMAAAPLAVPFLAAATAVMALVDAYNRLRYTGTDVGAYYSETTVAQRTADANALFNAGQNNVNSGQSNPITGGINPVFSGVGGGGKAEGGPVYGGMPVTVGERGKEWFVPSSNGTIVNQRQMKGMGGVSIGTLVLNGIQDPQAMFDAIQKVARERSN
jgi:TP901 family phage tail tape measure protein